MIHKLWRTEDNWPKKVVDSKLYYWSSEAIVKLGCLVAGHKPMPDQCGMPKHDLCTWCQKSMPFAYDPYRKTRENS